MWKAHPARAAIQRFRVRGGWNASCSSRRRRSGERMDALVSNRRWLWLIALFALWPSLALADEAADGGGETWSAGASDGGNPYGIDARCLAAQESPGPLGDILR